MKASNPKVYSQTKPQPIGELCQCPSAVADPVFHAPGQFGVPGVLVTLDPGVYTVKVSGVGNTTGVALVEIYEVLE